MELSLPYLILRKLSSPTQSYQHLGKDASYWTNLPFFNSPESSVGPDHSYWTIHEATTSVVICGASEYEWTGYAFGNGIQSDNEIFDDITEYEHEQNDEHMPVTDMFASYGSICQPLDSTNEEWDPRKYFLRVMKIRTEKVLREWTYLICSLEHGVVKWVSNQITFDGGLH
jgi:hypothetical protein